MRISDWSSDVCSSDLLSKESKNAQDDGTRTAREDRGRSAESRAGSRDGAAWIAHAIWEAGDGIAGRTVERARVSRCIGQAIRVGGSAAIAALKGLTAQGVQAEPSPGAARKRAVVPPGGGDDASKAVHP